MDQNPDSQRRMMIAIGVSLLLWMAYTTFFAPKPPPPELGGADAGQVAKAPDAGPADAGVAAADAGAVAAAPEVSPAAPAVPVQQLAVETHVVRYGLTNDGAGLVKAELEGAKMREQAQLTFKQ